MNLCDNLALVLPFVQGIIIIFIWIKITINHKFKREKKRRELATRFCIVDTVSKSQSHVNYYFVYYVQDICVLCYLIHNNEQSIRTIDRSYAWPIWASFSWNDREKTATNTATKKKKKQKIFDRPFFSPLLLNFKKLWAWCECVCVRAHRLSIYMHILCAKFRNRWTGFASNDDRFFGIKGGRGGLIKSFKHIISSSKVVWS